jgi:hypothetical protein
MLVLIYIHQGWVLQARMNLTNLYLEEVSLQQVMEV